jgi:hypothetical protein
MRQFEDATLVIRARLSFCKLVAVIAVLLSTGCAALPQPPVHPVTDEVPRDFPIELYRGTGDGRIFRIHDALLTLKTYRAGWLQGLAHNHVMTTTDFFGLVYLSPDPVRSFADAFFRPYDLILDEPAARQAAGVGFESVRTDDDIAATRSRMLGPGLLASNEFPFISVQVSPAPDHDQVVLTLSVRNEKVHKVVPISWTLTQGQLHAESNFQISHTELMLKPYSAFAYALAVADQIDVAVSFKASEIEKAALETMR